jgi:hypothetical protein
MITVLIRVQHGPEALAVTLSALIPAVADGLIADAVVLVSTADDTVASVAEAVGATLVMSEKGDWAPGAQSAKRDWLLCLDDGDMPSEGWIRTLERFVALSPPSRRFGRLERRPRNLSERWRRAFRATIAPNSVRAGDLVRRSVLTDPKPPGRPVPIGARIERDPVFD